MSAIYPWAATGPGCDASGACEKRDDALMTAAGYLQSGQATTAEVEEAVVVSGRMRRGGRQQYYHRTGQAWEAKVDDGHVTWVPVARAQEPAAP